ncbi:MAG: M28 family metallopeptidase [Terriglobia bacterium]
MRTRLIVLFPIAVLLGSLLLGSAEEPLRGFTPARSVAQRALEKKFLAVPAAQRAEEHHRILTEEPHPAGSEADRRTAEYVLEQFRAAGLEATIEEFHVLLPEPKKIKLELLVAESTSGAKAPLTSEAQAAGLPRLRSGQVKSRPANPTQRVVFSGPRPERVPEDPASRDQRTLPGFNAYAASGDVTAEVVYVHQGLPADYQRLHEEGISVEGKIALARYGGSFRGVKAKVAEENGAAGLIIYSDPEDDGYHAGDADVYPNGPWRPASGVQRGAVLFIFEYPGDPTTPGGPSLAGAPRIASAQATNMPGIPVLPLSYADARVLLEDLGGKAAPRAWQGGLPLTYHVGPGPVRARMQVEIDYVVKPVWNVVGKIHGQNEDEIVVMGNHRDAWTYGGVDPNSGTAAMLEMARGLGSLLKEGWRPRRSLWLLSWDAEEQGLLGSTEWAEKHAEALQQEAVAYLNLDSAVSGQNFGAQAVPSLKEFLRAVAADTPDPRGGSVLKHANQRVRERLRRGVVPGRVPAGGADATPIAERELELGQLGSGSDYTAFLDHLGIPATNFGFRGRYGVYHSIFDNHRWMKQWGDPEFRFHVAAAQFYGLQALRLAEADLLPFDYAAYGREIGNYLKGIGKKLRLLGQGGELDFARAQEAAARLARMGQEVREKYEWAISRGVELGNLDRVNRALVAAEQAFLHPQGLPGRPFFRHVIYAPGTYTGYASVPLPGVHESIDAEDFEEARRQLEALTSAVNRAADLLESIR